MNLPSREKRHLHIIPRYFGRVDNFVRNPDTITVQDSLLKFSEVSILSGEISKIEARFYSIKRKLEPEVIFENRYKGKEEPSNWLINEAKKIFLESIELYDSNKDEFHEAFLSKSVIFKLMGEIYERCELYDFAEEYYIQALNETAKFTEKSPQKPLAPSELEFINKWVSHERNNRAHILIDLAYVYMKLHRYDESIILSNKAIELSADPNLINIYDIIMENGQKYFQSLDSIQKRQYLKRVNQSTCKSNIF